MGACRVQQIEQVIISSNGLYLVNIYVSVIFRKVNAKRVSNGYII